MSRAQQSSIRSFFQPRRQPEFAAPPSTAPPQDKVATQLTSPPAAPPPPPPPEPRNVIVAESVSVPITLPPNGIPILPSPPSLPSGATIVPLAEQHLPALRRINSLLLPVPYPDSFYAKALDPLASGLFSRVILWQDSDADAPKVIGGLICRLEPNPFLDAHGQPLPHPSPPSHPQKPTSIPPNTPYHAIYIQSLVLLSPYRSLGLAAAALDHIIASAALLPAAGSSIEARSIYAHVWTENEEGLKWYEARGFVREGSGPVKGYYFKLRPDTAWVVRRHIGVGAGCVAGCVAGRAAASVAGADEGTVATSSSPPDSSPRTVGTVLAAAVNLPAISASPPAPPPPTAATSPLSQTTGSNGGPPRSRPSPAPSAASSTLSFQKARPETEWNDLPADMVVAASGVPPGRSSSQQLLSPNNGSAGPASGASSRSSSTAARKRKERAYPSAAFGGQ